MVVKDVYDSALHLLAESTEVDANDDYEERVPYLIAAFCSDAREIDAAIRKSKGDSTELEIDGVYVPLQASFPLLPLFAAPAALYLAAMLVIDELPDLSDRLYDKYSDSMARICSSIPAFSERIKNRYFFD